MTVKFPLLKTSSRKRLTMPLYWSLIESLLGSDVRSHQTELLERVPQQRATTVQSALTGPISDALVIDFTTITPGRVPVSMLRSQDAATIVSLLTRCSVRSGQDQP